MRLSALAAAAQGVYLGVFQRIYFDKSSADMKRPYNSTTDECVVEWKIIGLMFLFHKLALEIFLLPTSVLLIRAAQSYLKV